MATRPTDFPGLVIDPYRQCVVNQVEVARFPVRVCECFNDCTNPGAPLPLIVECFIYGEGLGDEDKGCPIITGGALGVTLGTLETHFLVRLQLTQDTDFLAGGGDPTNTALRFNLYLAKPVGVYEVFLVDDTGQRTWISFAPSVGSVLWVNIPLADFTNLDAGFNWNAVRYIYWGFTDNFQVASCMMALDNVRVCTNQAGIGGFAFEPDTEPYGSNNPGDSCFMVEEFSTEAVLERVLCDAPEPGPPTPEQCNECVIGPPLTNGNQAVHFCLEDPLGAYPPSIRYIPVSSMTLVTNVTFTVYSWRPGVNVRVILVDDQSRRAIYNFVAVGGAQTLTVAFASFALPDGGFTWATALEWWTIFGTAGYNANDRFGLDELKTNTGATLVNDMSTLDHVECGYDPEPGEPGGTLTCEFTQRSSIINPPTVTKFDSLTWAGPLSIGTVSQTCDAVAGYWDLGFDYILDPTADVQIAFNLPVAPNPNSAREIILTLFDEAGREVMIEVSPPALSPGDNLLTLAMSGGKVGQPTLESKGNFNPRRVMYWQIGFVGFTAAEVYPFVIHFEGFRFRVNAAPTKSFLFNNYADQPAFELAGGYTCFEDWRLVNINPVNTSFSFLCGGGVTVNTDAAFAPQNVGVDRGREPISVAGQEIRAERWFDPPIDVGALNWSHFELKYRARPDPGAPAQMHLVIQDNVGATATYSFLNGSGVLDANGVRSFTTAKGSFNQPIGNVNNDIWLIRLVKEGIANQSRTGTEGAGEDIYSGDEIDFVEGTFFPGFPPVTVSGKASTSTVQSIRNRSIGAMGGDDQPAMFDGHIHHETDCDPNFQAGDPPPVWPYTPAESPDQFEGWLKLYKLVEGNTGMMRFGFPGAPIDISMFFGAQDYLNVWALGTAIGAPVVLYTLQNVKLVLYDSGGGYLDIPMTRIRKGIIPINDNNFHADDTWWAMQFRLLDGVPDPGPLWDPTKVVYAELVAQSGWFAGKTWFSRVDIGQWSTRTVLFDWGRANWPHLMAFTNPSNQFTVGKVLDPSVTPVVALNCDKTRSISYWGMAEDWIRASEIVLVPAKYRDDPIVGINGNRGYDEFGNPLPGTLEALARDTRAWYGNAAFKVPPFAGCRNIWMDLCYIDEVVCLGVDLEKALYDFWDTSCPCWGPQQEISTLTTDRWMDRILPDDQFIIEQGAHPLPSGYPEAAYFEYCAIPDLDQEAVDDTDPAFTFKRETPTCSRPDDPINGVFGHYVVRVTLTAKQAPITINWADVLPGGETLVQGAMSDPAILLVNVGDTAVREYMLRTAQLQGGGVAITGAAVVVPNPPVTLVSPAISMDVDCDTLSWHQFGTQNPNVYGVAYWAGGGRPDPVVPAGVNLWTKVWAGPGSAGLSKREQYLFANATIPASTSSWTFQLGGTGVEGFAVGLPVWIFNTDFVDNPARGITGLDIEAEEALAPNHNEEVTGLYGIVKTVNPGPMTVEVDFNAPTNQQVRFTTLAKACIMVAPDRSRGYYWEASPALVDVCNLVPYTDPDVHHMEMRWGFRFWNSTKYPAPGTSGAGYICDGDGESYNYEFHGDLVKEIINPVDWMDLLCSPVQEAKLANDALPTQDDVRVCDICLFEPCDIIQIVDEDCTGKEGGGPGYVGTVVSTLPDDPGLPCDSVYATEGHVRIIPAIPTAVVGCGAIDGFLTTQRARAFVKPDVARYAYSPTTKVYPDGVPVEGQNFVGVDFETGTFTFIPGIVVSNPCACFRSLNAVISLPRDEQQALLAGIYFLKGIDKSGCKSPPSKPVKVVGAAGPEPDDCGVGRSPILLFQKQIQGNETVYPLAHPNYQFVNGATFNFSLAVPSRVEFRVSLFGWDVLFGSVGGRDASGWTELWVRDETSGTYYPLADRLTFGTEDGTDAVGTDSGAGSVCSRVVDLPAGNHVFNLYVLNAGPGSMARIRFPVDIQVWKFGRCEPIT